MNEEVLPHWGLSRQINKRDADNSLLYAKVYFRNKPLFHCCVWDKCRPIVDAFYVVGSIGHLFVTHRLSPKVAQVKEKIKIFCLLSMPGVVCSTHVCHMNQPWEQNNKFIILAVRVHSYLPICHLHLSWALGLKCKQEARQVG